METTLEDSLLCIAYEVLSTDGADNVRSDVALGVSFAVAFVVGALLALIASIFLFRYLAKKGVVGSSSSEDRDAEKDDFKSAKVNYQKLKRESHSLHEDKLKKDENIEAVHSKDLQISLPVIPLNSVDVICLCDILLLPTYSESTTALLRLQMLTALLFETSIMEERINGHVFCARDVLTSQLRRNKITKFQFQEVVGKFVTALNSHINAIEKESELKRKELKKLPKEDSSLLEIEHLKQYLMYFGRLMSIVENAGDLFKKSLSSVSDLSLNEGMTERFLEQITKLESSLNIERFQQTIFLDELHVKKVHVVENVQLQRQQLEAEATGRHKVLSAMLQNLSAEKFKLSEREKSTISGYCGDSLKSLNNRFNRELNEKLSAWALKSQQIHHEKLRTVVETQRKRRSEFISGAARLTSDDEPTGSFLEFLNALRRQRNETVEELDREDSDSVDSILREHELSCRKSLDENDIILRDAFNKHVRLSEPDSAALWRQFQDQLQQELRMISLEKREKLRQITEKCSLDQIGSQELRKKEKKIKTRFEGILFGVFRTQTLLSPEARQMMQKYHDENVVGVCNQLLMMKFRDERILKWLEQLRKPLFEDARNESRSFTKEKKTFFSKKSPEKSRKQQMVDRASMERAVAAAEDFVLTEAGKSESEISMGYEARLARIIGHQVAAEARKHALSGLRKDATIDRLGAQLLKELGSEIEDRDDSDSEQHLEVFAQQHLIEVSEMIEEFRLGKLRQDDIIDQKVESKQHTKERDVASEFNRRSRKQWEENNPIVEHFEQVSTQRLFHESLNDLKQESVVEAERLKEEDFSEMDSELQLQLMEQKKVFLAQAMAVAKLSKETIEKIVSTASHEAGIDEREALKLTKELLVEVQNVRINSGLTQRPLKPKSSKYAIGPTKQPTSTKVFQRSTTDSDFGRSRQSLDTPRREKTSHLGFQNRSYLDSDEEISIHRSSLPQRPQSAFRKSAEV